jgi:enoyl-CoA hydratase/3-hydroxyacyl-CoA dehydrogenase
MLTRARRLGAAAARELRIVDALVAARAELLPAAVELVGHLAGKRHEVADGPVEIPPFAAEPEAPGGRVLSAEVSEILRSAVSAAARAPTFAEALEIGYRAFGDSACTAAAREGIAAFEQGRTPDFERTG